MQYKEAANKNRIIGILAELNCTDDDTIRRVLRENGIDPGEKKKRRYTERVMFREVFSGRTCGAAEAARVLWITKANFYACLSYNNAVEKCGMKWVRVSGK